MALEESPSSGPDRLTEAPTLAFPATTIAPGEIPGDRYRIHSLLGRGGMGEVWRAFDLKLRVDVALKALRRELLEDNHALELLRQEVRAAREVVSPNVCRVFDLEELDGQELVSMEYIDGTTLVEILRERGPLDLEEAREIASQFLAGLEAIHLAGLVHRDVKPENIMLTRSGRVVVMDFGVAKRLADKKLGSIAGTPAYMAPEQVKGQEIDARADVFSAGLRGQREGLARCPSRPTRDTRRPLVGGVEEGGYRQPRGALCLGLGPGPGIRRGHPPDRRG
jgi:serine/threonine-protein kinase